MLTITQILNGSAPVTIIVFCQGSRPTDDTKWLALKLHDVANGTERTIAKLPADTSVPGQINVSGSGMTSGKAAYLSVAFTRANDKEIEGSNLVSIVPL